MFWPLASRQYALLVFVDPPNPTSGNLLHVVLLLFLLLIYSSRVYILGVVYPWPLLIWVVAILISVHYRLALQRKVLGRIRVDALLSTSLAITLIPASVHGIAMCIRDLDYHPAFLVWDLFPIVYSLTLIAVLSFGVAFNGTLLLNIHIYNPHLYSVQHESLSC